MDSNPVKWAPEMVVRPVSFAYAMMSVAHSLNIIASEQTRSEVIYQLRSAYNMIQSWENTIEILQHYSSLKDSLVNALNVVAEAGLQKPFLVQPIWKTKAQSFILEFNCFDVFIWSDVAVLFLPTDQSEKAGKVTRTMRETARHIRALYSLLTQNDYPYQSIYKGMELGNQTDKAFSLSGSKSRCYLSHNRLLKPLIKRDSLSQLIMGGGENELKQERRFDAAVQAFMMDTRFHAETSG